MKSYLRTCLYVVLRCTLIGIPTYSLALVASALFWIAFDWIIGRPQNELTENIIDAVIYGSFIMLFIRSKAGKIYDEFCLFLTQKICRKEITQTLTWQWLQIMQAMFNSKLWHFSIAHYVEEGLSVAESGKLDLTGNFRGESYANIQSPVAAFVLLKVLDTEAERIADLLEGADND